MAETNESTIRSLIQVHLASAVPLRIAELQERRGPTSEDFERLRDYAPNELEF